MQPQRMRRLFDKRGGGPAEANHIPRTMQWAVVENVVERVCLTRWNNYNGGGKLVTRPKGNDPECGEWRAVFVIIWYLVFGVRAWRISPTSALINTFSVYYFQFLPYYRHFLKKKRVTHIEGYIEWTFYNKIFISNERMKWRKWLIKLGRWWFLGKWRREGSFTSKESTRSARASPASILSLHTTPRTQEGDR